MAQHSPALCWYPQQSSRILTKPQTLKFCSFPEVCLCPSLLRWLAIAGLHSWHSWSGAAGRGEPSGAGPWWGPLDQRCSPITARFLKLLLRPWGRLDTALLSPLPAGAGGDLHPQVHTSSPQLGWPCGVAEGVSLSLCCWKTLEGLQAVKEIFLCPVLTYKLSGFLKIFFLRPVFPEGVRILGLFQLSFPQD